MDIEEFKSLAVICIQRALLDHDPMFSVSFGEVLVDGIDDDYISVTVTVKFTYGNIEREHPVYVGWNEDDGMGLEYGEDSTINPITAEAVMFNLYVNLALVGLDDKYLI